MISDRFYSIFLKVAGAALLLTFFVMMASAVKMKAISEVSLFHVEIQYEGEPLIHSLDIRASVAKKFPHILTSAELGTIDLSAIEAHVESFSAIEDVNVYADAAGRINILAKQRRPILRLYTGKGFNGYLDAAGNCFEASEGSVARLPVVTGRITGLCDKSGKQKISMQQLTRLGSMIAEDEFLTGLVEQIHIQDYANVYLVPKIGRQKILLGNLDHLSRKMEYLNIFYKEGLTRKGFRTYSLIDLRFDGQVVAKRMEN